MQQFAPRRLVNPIQETDERVMPAALPGSTRSEQVVTGEQVEEVLSHPGFQAVVSALHFNAESALNMRVFRKPDADAASYAHTMGHLQGLREVVPIARGLVQNGKEAAQAIREQEES